MFLRHYDTPTLQHDFDTWRETYRSIVGQYNPQCPGESGFAGWAHTFSGSGFQAGDVGWNQLDQIGRTQHDAHVDGIDNFCALIQIVGSATVCQNDHIVQMAVGDVMLHDKSRPFVARYEGHGHWFGLQLPREVLISHLGFEPIDNPLGQGGPRAGRLLHEVALSALHGEEVSSSPADGYLQLAVYDLIGALFTQQTWPSFRRTDSLFKRLCRIIDHNFSDPDFGPQELAAEAGISVSYVHKLFGERGNACTAFIYARRLDHAAQLLHRQSALRTRQPISEIAYACGFHDQTHFTRKFRRRFGSTPGDYKNQRVKR